MKHPIFTQGQPYTIAYRKNKPQTPVAIHSHDAAELYLTLTDLEDVILEDKVLRVPAGTLIVIPPFCLHQLYHNSDVFYERYVINIQMKWLDDVFSGTDKSMHYLDHSSAPVLISLSDDQLKEIIKQIRKMIAIGNEFNSRSFSDFFLLMAKIDEAVFETVSKNKDLYNTNKTQEKVSEMISYINDHIYDEISVSSIAEHFYLNPDYISRLFKRYAHASLGKYITLSKMSAAQNLLKQGFSVKEVQEKLEYSSYAHFFKTFKNTVGISPSIFRKNNLN